MSCLLPLICSYLVLFLVYIQHNSSEDAFLIFLLFEFWVGPVTKTAFICRIDSLLLDWVSEIVEEDILALD